MREAHHKGICTADGGWSALTLLAVVHKRARDFEQQIRSELGHLDMPHSLHTELTFFESHSAEDFEQTVHAILEQRIISGLLCANFAIKATTPSCSSRMTGGFDCE